MVKIFGHTRPEALNLEVSDARQRQCANEVALLYAHMYAERWGDNLAGAGSFISAQGYNVAGSTGMAWHVRSPSGKIVAFSETHQQSAEGNRRGVSRVSLTMYVGTGWRRQGLGERLLNRALGH